MLFGNQMLDVTGCMLCFRRKCNVLFNLVVDFFATFPISALVFFRILWGNVSKWIDSVIEKSNRTLQNELVFSFSFLFFMSCGLPVIFCDMFRVWHATYVHASSNENICMHFSRFTVLTIAHKLPGEYFQVIRHNDFIHIPSLALSLIKIA